MPPVGGVAPDEHGLGGEHAVGKGYDEDAPGLEDAVHFLEDFDGPGQVLHRYRNDDGVKGIVLVGQDGVLVDVLNHIVVQVRVLRHLHGVHAQSRQPLPGVVRRPVGAPAAHQVQHHRIRGNQAAEDIAHRGNGHVVNVDHQPGLNVEIAVVAFVLPPKVFGQKGRERRIG